MAKSTKKNVFVIYSWLLIQYNIEWISGIDYHIRISPRYIADSAFYLPMIEIPIRVFAVNEKNGNVLWTKHSIDWRVVTLKSIFKKFESKMC